MNISPWTIYLWGQLDTIRGAFGFLGFLLVIFGPMFWCMANDCFEDDSKRIVKRAANIGLIFGVLFGIASIFTPSSKTFAAIVIVPAIANSKPIQKDVPELYEAAVSALKAKLGQQAEQAAK